MIRTHQALPWQGTLSPSLNSDPGSGPRRSGDQNRPGDCQRWAWPRNSTRAPGRGLCQTTSGVTAPTFHPPPLAPPRLLTRENRSLTGPLADPPQGALHGPARFLTSPVSQRPPHFPNISEPQGPPEPRPSQRSLNPIPQGASLHPTLLNHRPWSFTCRKPR